MGRGAALFVAVAVGVLMLAATAYGGQKGIYFTPDHVAFKKPLPYCLNKDVMYGMLEKSIRHPVAWVGRDEKYPGNFALFTSRKETTWFLVAYKDDNTVACIISRGNGSRTFIGSPT